MEPFNYNAKEALLNVNLTTNQQTFIISRMISLLKKQIYKYNLFLYDVKPENFLVNITSGNRIERICMIDFDPYYSAKTQDDLSKLININISYKYKVDLYYLIILLQLYLNLKEYELPAEILRPFFKEHIFKDRFNFIEEMKMVVPHSESNKLSGVFYHYVCDKDPCKFDDIVRLI